MIANRPRLGARLDPLKPVFSDGYADMRSAALGFFGADGHCSLYYPASKDQNPAHRVNVEVEHVGHFLGGAVFGVL